MMGVIIPMERLRKRMGKKEYIEREAFLEQKREQYCKDCARRKGMRNGKYKTLYEIGEAPCRACEIDDVLNDVEDFPAADVRPVVFCRNCKYWELSKIFPSFHVCTYVCGATFVRNQDDFCSRGEVRNVPTNCGADMREES